MRVLVIGVGSIGSRRSRILADMGHDVEVYDVALGVTAFAVAVPSDGGACTFVHSTMASALATEPDAAFICTPAESHVNLAHVCIACGIPVFVEKPLALTMDGVPELVAAAEERGLVTMGACNLRWAYQIPDEGWDNIRFVSRQPLKDWRPGAVEAYRHHGIILESAIHEMDLAYSLLGPIGDWQSYVNEPGRINMQFTHERGRSRIRCEWGDHAPTRRWILAHRGDDSSNSRDFFPDLSDAMYQAEMQHFLDCVREKRPTCCTLRDAAHVLEWAVEANERVNV